MSDSLYTLGKEHLLGGDIDLQNDDIAVLLLSADYIANLDTDECRTSIPDAAIVAEARLHSKKITGGVFDADDLTFQNVSGDPITQFVILKDVDIYSQAWLILHGSISVTPDGTQITVQWDNGDDKIFRI